jgi:predicted RNA-binding protein with PIN domain
MSKQPHLLIDGYNVIFKRQGLADNSPDALQQSRDKLIQQLVAYQSQKKIKVTVVFDGKGRIHPEKMPLNRGVKVLFSHAPETADQLIKRILEREHQPKNTTLVTSDQALAYVARTQGADVWSVDKFLQQDQKRKQSDLERHKLNAHISKKELEEWLRLFGEDTSS